MAGGSLPLIIFTFCTYNWTSSIPFLNFSATTPEYSKLPSGYINPKPSFSYLGNTWKCICPKSQQFPPFCIMLYPSVPFIFIHNIRWLLPVYYFTKFTHSSLSSWFAINNITFYAAGFVFILITAAQYSGRV